MVTQVALFFLEFGFYEIVYSNTYCIAVGGVFREGYHGEACSCEIKKLSPGTTCVIRVCAITAGGAGKVCVVKIVGQLLLCISGILVEFSGHI